MNFQNIEIEQGTSYSLSLTYTDDHTGLPKDLTGYTARLAVKPIAGLPPVIDLLSTGTQLVLGGVTGNITAYFAPSDSSGQTWSQAPYDLVLTDPLGVKTKILKGILTILPTESE
jgi:hypothetical protein